MKKSILFLLLTGCLLFQTSTAMADYIYEIKAGDRIQFTKSTGPNGGGEFTWVANNGYTWQSFCVEKNEYITLNSTYTVEGLSNYAKAGGIGGASNGMDQLSDETAWLFWNFSKGKLGEWTGYAYTSANQGDLQNLIWYLEGEITSLTTNAFISNWRQGYANAYSNGWVNNGQVQVVNLKGHQDQLIIGNYHAPEPGTMILLGFGLIGIAGIGRKKLKK